MGKRREADREMDRTIRRGLVQRNRDVAREPIIKDVNEIQREHERRTREHTE